jgi:hypothetical protein
MSIMNPYIREIEDVNKAEITENLKSSSSVPFQSRAAFFISAGARLVVHETGRSGKKNCETPLSRTWTGISRLCLHPLWIRDETATTIPVLSYPLPQV